MEPQADIHKKKGPAFSLYLKCSAVLVLFFFSVLIVACGGGTTNSSMQSNVTNPVVTVTISLGNTNTTPLPTMTPYTCGAWTTNTSPAYNASTEVAVYAKYTQSVNGNPQGVDAATATATIHWGDGTADIQTINTTSDGLAVFDFNATNKGTSVGKLTLVTVTFTKDGTPGCTVGTDRAAFFTLIVATATASGTPSDQNGNNNNNSGNGKKKKKHG
jgi:uncharacterized protein involved in high-affinity Fe2+ transport